MSTVVKNCECCGAEMKVRSADLKRGWGRFCSKACKAREQERRTHQYGNYRGSGVDRDTYLAKAREFGGVPQFDRHGNYTGFVGGGFDNTEHQDHERE